MPVSKQIKPLLFFLFLFLLAGQLLAQIPKAGFTANKTSGCSPLTVIFSNSSTGGAPITYTWRFGNGNISNLGSPTVSATYVLPGTYTVSLTAANASGVDSLVRTSYITVYASPVANFNSVPAGGCTPLGTTFSDISTKGSGNIISWLWDFGDGSSAIVQNPGKTFTTAGSYNVTLIVTDNNGCEGRVTKNNYINTTPSHTVAFTGSPLAKCRPSLTTTFNSTVTPTASYNYLWEFGDGNTSNQAAPVHTYTTGGNKTVTLTVTSAASGCTVKLKKVNYVFIPDIKPDFTTTITAGCAPVSVNFTNTSTPDTIGMVYTWTGPNGFFSGQKNPLPAKVYQSGQYTYRLISRWTGGCADTVEKTINVSVLPKPEAGFTSLKNNFCVAPFNVSFINTSTGASTYNWIFSEGGTSTQTNPVRSYSNFGRYSVKLIATSTDGCKDTFDSPNYIKSFPSGFILKNTGNRSGCAPLTTSFHIVDTGVVPFTNYSWKFGNGDTANGTLVNYTYSSPGKYVVTVKGKNSDGCEATRTDTIYVGLPFPFSFSVSPSSGCYSTYAGKLILNPPLNPGTADTVIWKLYQNGVLVKEYYDTGAIITDLGLGNFDIEGIVSINGCRTTVRINNAINISGPEGKFVFAKVHCTTNKFSFSNQSLQANKLLWIFPDSTTANTDTISKTFNLTGAHKVKLIVYDTTTSCTDTVTKEIFIGEAPKLNFTVSDSIGCSPLTFQVRDTSTATPPVKFAYYQFKLSNGQVGNSAQSTFTVGTSGFQSITLTITDTGGCKHVLVKDSAIYVYKGFSKLHITPPIGCVPLLVTGIDSGTTENPVASYIYRWGNGDSLVSTSSSVNYTYLAPKFDQKVGFSATLEIIDNKGCRFLSPPVVIKPVKPAPIINIQTFKKCGQDSVRFIATNNQSTGWVPKFKWALGDGSILTGPTVMKRFTGDTTFRAVLTITDTAGCVDSVTKDYRINTTPPISKFDADPKKLDCYKPAKIIHFADSTKAGAAGIASYLWQFGDNSSSALKYPDKVYSKPGVYSVSLEVTDSIGCKNKLTMPDFVVVGGPYGTHSYTPRKGCVPLDVDFQTVSPNAMLFIWDHADGNVDTLKVQNHQYKYTLPGVYYPRITLVDSSGTCDFGLDAIDSIVVHPLPPVDFAASDTLICKGSSITFNNTTGAHHIPVTQWKWHFGSNDSSTLFGPHTIPFAEPGKFTISLTGTDTLGCTNTITKDSLIHVYYDSIPPDKPYLLRATVEDNTSVLMQFNANKEPDFKEYVIHYNYISGFPNSAATRYQISDTNFTETGINTLHNNYSYRLYAIDVCRNVSDFSETHTTVELTATATGNAVFLKWTPYKGWDSIERYEVWKNDPDFGNSFYKIAETQQDTLNYTDTNIVCFKPYNYRILAVEKGGKLQVSWSDTSTATPKFVPLVPGTRNIRATVENNKYVRLEWRQQAYKLPFRYAIFRSEDNAPPAFYKDIKATDTLLLDLDVDVQKHSYNYITYLIDSCGGISPASNLAKSILLQLEMVGNDILTHDPVLNWNAYSDWYSGVDYYHVEFFYDSLDNFSLISRNQPDNLTARHRYVNLEQQDYCYKVTAFQKDSNDIISESNIACIETAPRLHPPNVFTVNGDNLNDTYKLGGLFIDKFELKIYNRWGLLMFETDDIHKGWDGNFEGKPCPSDVYIYIARGIGRRGQIKEVKGNVTLLR